MDGNWQRNVAAKRQGVRETGGRDKSESDTACPWLRFHTNFNWWENNNHNVSLDYFFCLLLIHLSKPFCCCCCRWLQIAIFCGDFSDCSTLLVLQLENSWPWVFISPKRPVLFQLHLTVSP